MFWIFFCFLHFSCALRMETKTEKLLEEHGGDVDKAILHLVRNPNYLDYSQQWEETHFLPVLHELFMRGGQLPNDDMLIMNLIGSVQNYSSPDRKDMMLPLIKGALAAGCNKNTQSPRRRTILFQMVDAGIMECVRFLLESGAELITKATSEQASKFHTFELNIAAQANRLDICKCLIDYGADLKLAIQAIGERQNLDHDYEVPVLISLVEEEAVKGVRCFRSASKFLNSLPIEISEKIYDHVFSTNWSDCISSVCSSFQKKYDEKIEKWKEWPEPPRQERYERIKPMLEDFDAKLIAMK